MAPISFLVCGVMDETSPQMPRRARVDEWCGNLYWNPYAGLAQSRGRMAARHRSHHPRHGHHWWADAHYRLGPFDHRMGPDHGRDPAPERRAMGRGLRQISEDPAICPGEPGHEPSGVPGNFLVGMDASFPGPSFGCGVFPALPVVRLERRD